MTGRGSRGTSVCSCLTVLPQGRTLVGMARRLVAVVIASIALALTVPGAALAVPAQVTVTNLAQPGLASAVPQPPLSVPARGSCATPYSAQEANTGISPCSPGSWPANPGAGGANPDWRPQVSIAGGDRLQLTFDAPADQVRYASTTNFPKGFTNPVGQPHLNGDIITARDAEATGDAKVWTVQLPLLRFEDTGFFPGTEFTFPVVARVGTTWRNFALSIRAPRFNDPRTGCGIFWSTDNVDPGCLMPPGGPPRLGSALDRTAPSLRVRVPRRQRVRRTRPAIAYTRCDELCTVRITGRLKVGRRSQRLRTASKAAAAGKLMKVRVPLTRRAARVLRQALRSQQRATIVLAVRARDTTGNHSTLARRTITVR